MNESHPTQPSCQQLLQLKPGISTLQDVYERAGYPRLAADMSSGVALGYDSVRKDWPSIVLVDGKTGMVKFVSVIAFDEHDKWDCPTFGNLMDRYGKPTLVNFGPGSRQHWFFKGKNIAFPWTALQVLPPGTTLEQYKTHDGYIRESYVWAP